MIDFKGARFQKDIILTWIRWYLEEKMAERVVCVDHSTIHWWVVKHTPQLEKAFNKKTNGDQYG